MTTLAFNPLDSHLCATGGSQTLHLSLPEVLFAASAVDRPGRPRLQAAFGRGKESLERYGPAKAIVLARFIPVVRSVINPLAGMVGVPVRTFTVAQIGGGLVWAIGVTLAGYALGSRIPNIDTYLLPIIAVIVVVSLIPLVLELRRARRVGDQT